MATGDITSVAIRADGWSADVTIAGFTTGATYDFGSLASSPATVDSPKFTMTVVSEGYNSSGVLGTATRTVYGTHAVRKAYPNEASKDEDTATTPGSMIVRVALSECVYNDDKNGGAGTSGTNPTVTIAAGWCVNAGGASQSSAAATNMAVTNNSTLDYPKVIAQWAWGHTPAFRRVESAFDMGCIAYNGHGIACVALSATEGVNSVSGTVTTKTKHLMSASGLYYESYDLNVPLTSMTQGNAITLKFVAYPTVGDADSIIDTSAVTDVNKLPLGYAQITCTCDKSGALKDYAVVSTSGNDTTGAKSTTLSTALTTPYLTIGKALASGATVIYVRSGTYGILGSTPATVTARDYCVEVSPYNGESVSLTREGTWYNYKARHLRYSGFTITSSGAALSLDGATTGYTLQLENNTFTLSAYPSTGIGSSTKATIAINNTWSNRDNFNSSGATRFGYCLTGNNITGGIFRPYYGIVANIISGTATADETYFQEKTAASGSEVQNNVIVSNNKLVALKTSGSYAFRHMHLQALDGFAFIGNIIESIAGTQPLCGIGEGTTNIATSNAIVAHNTVVGERSNLFYNDAGTVAVYHTNIFVKNNAFESYNIKADLFAPASGNRIGNWAQINGVNYSDNRFDSSAGTQFVGDYYGINVSYVTSITTGIDDLGYTNNASKATAGSGNGNYLPATGSALKGHTLRVKYQSYDMNGTAV